MADQADISQRISQAKQARYSDSDIYSMLSNDASFQKRIAMAKKEGFTDEQIAGQLGLKVGNSQGRHLASDGYGDVVIDGASSEDTAQSNPNRVDVGTNPTITVKAEKPSFLADVGAGMDKVFSGAIQGAHWLGDKLQKPLNDRFGTHFDTNEYQKYTQQKADERKTYEDARAASGAGTNYGEFIGEMAATAPVAALARGYQGAKILSGAGAKVLAQNAALGGAIGGSQFAENADQRLANAGAGAIGGAAGSVVGEKIGQGIAKVGQKIARSTQVVSDADVNSKINVILSTLDDGGSKGSSTNIRLSDFSPQAQVNIKQQVKDLMKKGLSPDAQTLARMGVFTDLKSRGIDLKPTLKQATGNPNTWTKETELSKLSGAEKLSQKYADDHNNLRTALDDLEQKTGGNYLDDYATGDALLSSLRSQDKSRQNYVSAMYDYAKSLSGNDLKLDPQRFADSMKHSLDEDLVDINLIPAPLLKRTQEFIDGKVPFNLAQKEVLVKQINKRMQGADNETRYALKSFRDSLENEVNTSLDQFGSGLNQQAKQAWDDARKAAAGRFGLIDRTPAIQKALDDAEPDKAFDQLIWKGNVRQVESLANEIKNDQYAMDNIRQAIIRRISEKSVGVNGVFSPKGMDTALKSIGDRKLGVFFSDDELKYLKNIGLAGKYLISQPPGSNVNNSGTAAVLVNHFNVLSKLPVVKAIADKYVVAPARGVKAEVNIQSGAKALSKTAESNTQTVSDLDQSIIDQLRKAGFLSGANAANQ